MDVTDKNDDDDHVFGIASKETTNVHTPSKRVKTTELRSDLQHALATYTPAPVIEDAMDDDMCIDTSPSVSDVNTSASLMTTCQRQSVGPRVSVQDPQRPWLVQMMCPMCRHMFTYDRKCHGPLPLIGSCPNAQCGVCFCSGCGDTCPNGTKHTSEHDGTLGADRDCRQLYHMHWNEDGGDSQALWMQLDTIYRQTLQHHTPLTITDVDTHNNTLPMVGSALVAQPQNPVAVLLSSQCRMSPTEWRLVTLAQQNQLLEMWQQRIGTFSYGAKPLVTLPETTTTTTGRTLVATDSVVRTMAQHALKVLGWIK